MGDTGTQRALNTPRRLLAFAVLAVLIGGVNHWYEGYQARVVVCPSAEMLNARAEAMARQGLALEPSEVLRLLKDEQILLSEALLRGFHRFDPVVRQRLRQDLGFLNFDKEAIEKVLDRREGLGSELLEQLIQGDEVIRRRLRQLLIAQLAFEKGWPGAAGGNEHYRLAVKALRSRYRDHCHG